MTPVRKATFACLSFAGIGLFGWFTTGVENVASVPLLVYYAVLLINTFFSIRIFSAITPKSFVQTLFDRVAAVFYLALAFSFGSVPTFAAVSAGLFLLAVAKYVHLKGLVPSSALLPRKIVLNTLAALLSLFALALTLLGFSEAAAWVLCIIFALANIYLLIFNPMYRIERSR